MLSAPPLLRPSQNTGALDITSAAAGWAPASLAEETKALWWAAFAVECEQHLRILHQGAQQLANHSDDLEVLRAAFRAVHTLKACASFLEAHSITDLAHEVESILCWAQQHPHNVAFPLAPLLNTAAERLTD